MIRPTLATALALSTLLPAQDDAAVERLREQRDAKLAKQWLEAGGWSTDYREARERAAEQERVILAYFTRSFAPCAPCEALERSVFATEEFQQWAEGHVVPFCHVTSHVPGDSEPLLLREKGGSSFPYLAILDAGGRVLAKPAENTLPAIRQAVTADAAAFRDLERRAASDDAGARRELLVRRVELQHFRDFDAARDALAAAELPDAEAARLEQLLVEQEFNLVLGTVTDPADAARGGARVLPMYRQGRIARGEHAYYYWAMLAAHAAAERDAELLAEVLGEMADSDDRRVAALVPRFRKVLEALRRR